MEQFQVKIMPATDILMKCGKRGCRYRFFCEYKYNRVEDMAFMFDSDTETLYIPEHVNAPEKLTRILSRMMKRRNNGTKEQDADYDRLAETFNQLVYYPALDMFKHYWDKRHKVNATVLAPV
ncbi:MAG: hypothetical protein IJT94_06945 [Oscillibacter sp.]|nr:hypothetical protein [Oscillibacter sp.]